MRPIQTRIALATGLLLGLPAADAEDAAALAKELSNPVAALISVPLQSNWEQNIGPDDRGSRYTLNLQPVIPISIGEDWNLISRTILPIVDQWGIFPGTDGQFGLSDTVQSLFFSPKAPTAGGLIWGAGPVFLLPTATDELLGSEKWGAGPTAVGLVQKGPWTFGMLMNHIWSFAGPSERTGHQRYLSSSPLSPTPHPTPGPSRSRPSPPTIGRAMQWNVPIAAQVAKLTKIGGQLVQFQAGPRYYAASTDTGPEGWALRFNVVLLFPK